MRRRIVQIAIVPASPSHGAMLVAVAHDGTAWIDRQCNQMPVEWQELPELPESPDPPPGTVCEMPPIDPSLMVTHDGRPCR